MALGRRHAVVHAIATVAIPAVVVAVAVAAGGCSSSASPPALSALVVRPSDLPAGWRTTAAAAPATTHQRDVAFVACAHLRLSDLPARHADGPQLVDPTVTMVVTTRSQRMTSGRGDALFRFERTAAYPRCLVSSLSGEPLTVRHESIERATADEVLARIVYETVTAQGVHGVGYLDRYVVRRGPTFVNLTLYRFQRPFDATLAKRLVGTVRGRLGLPAS